MDSSVLKGRLKQEYHELTDDDLTYTEGQEEKLPARLQDKSGKSRKEIVELVRNNQ